MANWSLPSLTDLYTNVLQYLKDRDTDVSRWFSTRYTAATNVGDGTVRWNDTNKYWEIWNAAGSTWSTLTTQYKVDVDTVDGCHAGTAANNVLKLDSSGKVPLASLYTTLTGISSAQCGGYTPNTGTTASTIPVRNGSGQLPGDITGNAATATSATNADTVDTYHAATAKTANTIPVRDVNGKITADVAGNADTASKLAASVNINGVAFDGSVGITVTATPSAHTHAGTDVTSAVSNATNGRYVYDNGAYGGSIGYKEATGAYVAYAATAGNASTVGGEAVTTLAQHRSEGRNFIDYARYTYDSGLYSGVTGYKEAVYVKVANAGNADYATNAGFAPILNGTQAFTSPGTTSFTVPAGVTKLVCRVYGSGGNDASSGAPSYSYYPGGKGGYAEGILTVSPGQVMSVTVGAGGGTAASGYAASGGVTSVGTITATGGQGASIGAAGASGTGSGGYLNLSGEGRYTQESGVVVISW